MFETPSQPASKQVSELIDDAALAIAVLAKQRLYDGPGQGFNIGRQYLPAPGQGDPQSPAFSEIESLTSGNPYGKEFARALEERLVNEQTKLEIEKIAQKVLDEEGNEKACTRIAEMLLLPTRSGGVGTDKLPS